MLKNVEINFSLTLRLVSYITSMGMYKNGGAGTKQYVALLTLALSGLIKCYRLRFISYTIFIITSPLARCWALLLQYACCQ